MAPFCYSKGMKRFFLGFGVFYITLLGLSPLVQAQDVNNFKIKTFEAEYYLGKDSENRSTLKTIEKITAIFPEANQNHGLERVISKKYDGHSTSLRIESIKDEKGNTLSYSEDNSNDNLVLRIGDADTYVHGQKYYVITYIQRDATRFFANTNSDEFYWDVNGTQWRVPIDEVKATVHISSAVSSKLNGEASCYYGVEGSTAMCPVAKSGGDDIAFSASVTRLKPNENLTLAIGFQPQTFSTYQPSLFEKVFAIWAKVQLASIPVVLVVILLLVIRYQRVMNRAKGRGGIVTVEYLPPKDVSVLQGALVVKNSTSDITAQLIDLAVRHYIKIYQVKDKSWFRPGEYELEIVKDPANLLREEGQLLKDLFGRSNVKVGGRFAMQRMRHNHQLAKQLLASRTQYRDMARGEYALFDHALAEAEQMKKLGFVVVCLSLITVSPVIITVAIFAFSFAHYLWPLTQKGAELRDYLKGLKQYINTAEADRIKMLQSPDGAEKVGVKIENNDTVELVKLYERVLPYAVLFGVEKEWTKQLGAYYEKTGSEPDWYTGNTVFNAALFSSAVHGFSGQSSSYSSAVSSSSGGSSGGGSSGGGGGGGGGGGW